VNWARHRFAAIFIVLAGLLGVGGCVSVPTSGPIEKVEGPQRASQNINVEVRPPAPGDEPRQIVDGYLRANNNYQPNYSVAKQFLTRTAAESWSPEAGVWIYQGSPTATTASAILGGRLVGSLGRDRTYKVEDRDLHVDFNLVKDDKGEWRINKPPPGLMVAEYSFKSFYQGYDLYFIGNGSSLVPQPIYLPRLSSPANVASALMKALLNGPSTWLKPAVSTAIPPNTSLSMDSVTITDGIAEVPLSDSVLDLSDSQRSLLAAQIVYTLRQAGGVKGVVIKVNQQSYRVPGSDPNSQVVSVDAIPRDLDPIPFVAGEQLYAVRSGAVKQVTMTSDSPTVSPLPGPLAHGTNRVNSVAVSVTNTDLAVTTNDRTALRRAPVGGGDPITLLSSGVSDLLRPQFTRYGEIWAIGRQGGKQRIWMFTPGNKPVPINSQVLGDGHVTAFKISPDGTRMALVRTNKNRSELGLARIIRSDKIMVDQWRPLNIMQTNSSTRISKIADVAWLDATELMVLGVAEGATAYAPFRVAEDASQITPEGESDNWNAVELAVLPRTQTAIVVGRVGAAGKTWKDDGNQWLPFVDNVSTIAYPG
jgi:hypothetical protein